jgi:hypothetical protein
VKRSANRIADGDGPFKGWITYSAARPRKSRFEHNPNLYFMIDTEDHDDPVLVAGGLYVPSSRQLRALRETVARDATAFERLFEDKDFARSFKGGFSRDRTATRPPRGFDPAHPKMDWLKLQAFFVWKPYTMKQFVSPSFPRIVARDWKQILRMNRLLEKAIEGRLPVTVPKPRKSAAPARDLLDRLEGIALPRRPMDF